MMGTNYYLIYNECKCCNRYDEVHLGKSSCGWKFTFQSIENFSLKNIDHAHTIANTEEEITIKTWRDLKEFLYKYVVEFKTARIIDEYKDECSYKEFVEMVDFKFTKPENKSHYWYMKDDTQWKFDEENELIDLEGHSFSRREFS